MLAVFDRQRDKAEILRPAEEGIHSGPDLFKTYGFESILTLTNLEKIEVLKRQESKSAWPQLDKVCYFAVLEADKRGREAGQPRRLRLRLFGLRPLDVLTINRARLVEAAFKKGWKSIVEQLKLIPGPQSFPEKFLPPGKGQKSVAIVYIIGGVTFAEAAALRLVARQNSFEYSQTRS